MVAAASGAAVAAQQRKWVVNRPAGSFWTDETSDVRQRTFTFRHSADGQTPRRTIGLEEENFMPTSKTSEFVSVHHTSVNSN